ncbi:UNVERIFIED_CONTAM: hypothetical protein HDU68_003198 [Siphonaria sp. JEL0065]|nr:hypothetical protein HDU68_003198 [Siphonaria sp. JEL0065]
MNCPQSQGQSSSDSAPSSHVASHRKEKTKHVYDPTMLPQCCQNAFGAGRISSLGHHVLQYHRDKCPIPHCHKHWSTGSKDSHNNVGTHVLQSKDHCITDYKFACSNCNKRFKIEKEFGKHFTKVHASNVKHICTTTTTNGHQCGQTFDLMKDLTQHKKHAHPGKFSCVRCSRLFTRQGDLSNHMAQCKTIPRIFSDLTAPELPVNVGASPALAITHPSLFNFESPVPSVPSSAMQHLPVATSTRIESSTLNASLLTVPDNPVLDYLFQSCRYFFNSPLEPLTQVNKNTPILAFPPSTCDSLASNSNSTQFSTPISALSVGPPSELGGMVGMLSGVALDPMNTTYDFTQSFTNTTTTSTQNDLQKFAELGEFMSGTGLDGDLDNTFEFF